MSPTVRPPGTGGHSPSTPDPKVWFVIAILDLEGAARRTRSLDAVTGLSRKGLARGQIGIVGVLVVGISTCAPAVTLTASVGPAASVVGDQTSAIFLVGFIPMLLVALGYRALNAAMPNSGTSFTWGARAFGPWLGWLTGWPSWRQPCLCCRTLQGSRSTSSTNLWRSYSTTKRSYNSRTTPSSTWRHACRSWPSRRSSRTAAW